jgi:hypothetical protein
MAIFSVHNVSLDYEERLVAFIDVLGFSDLVKDSVAGVFRRRDSWTGQWQEQGQSLPITRRRQADSTGPVVEYAHQRHRGDIRRTSRQCCAEGYRTMKVEVKDEIPLNTKTVTDLRKLTHWSSDWMTLAIPFGRDPWDAVGVERRTDSSGWSPAIRP